MPTIQQPQHYYATGRRKTASARVYLQKGRGNILINGKTVEAYFGGLLGARFLIEKPLQVVSMRDKVDIKVFVKGSGPKGQAGAISHGIARALVEYDESGMVAPVVIDVRSDAVESSEGALSMRRALRKANCLTRDARKVERKKVGFRKARKVEQYSKR